MTIKDSFAKGPRIIRQRRLTAEEKAQLRGATDETLWNTERIAASLRGDALPAPAQPKPVLGGTLPGRRVRKFVSMGKQALDDGRLLVKLAYPSNMGTPHAVDVIGFVHDFHPGMEVESSNDRKAGLLELVLKVADNRQGQMDAANVPAGTAAAPIDGQRDPLSSEEVEGTGKIAQADPINGGKPCMHCGGGNLTLNEDKPWCMDCQAGASFDDMKSTVNDAAMDMQLMNMQDAPRLDGKPHPRPDLNQTVFQGPAPSVRKNTAQKTKFPEQIQSVQPPDLGADISPRLEAPLNDPEEDGVHPDADMTLEEALSLLQESTQAVVDKIQGGDAIVDGQEVEPAAEAPAMGAPPAAAPFAAGSPVTAQKDDKDPERVMDRALQETRKDKGPGTLMQKMMDAQQRARQRMIDLKQESGQKPADVPPSSAAAPVGDADERAKARAQQLFKEKKEREERETGLREPKPGVETSAPGAINKRSPSDMPDYGNRFKPQDQEFFWLDELADTRVNTTWNPGKRTPGTNELAMPPGIDTRLRNDQDRPYGHIAPDGKRMFQGIPFLSAEKGKSDREYNTLAGVLPTNIWKKVRTVTDPGSKRPYSKWQWQNLTPEERAQARHDMMFANKAIRDRIRNIMNQTPDGAHKRIKMEESDGPTPPRDMDTKPGMAPGKGGIGIKPVAPQVRKKSVIDEIVAVDPAAKKYWEDLLGQYGHQMVDGCCPEHDSILKQRQTDMHQIASELGIKVTDEQVNHLTASLHRPHVIGAFMEYARTGFAAPPMDKMVDMAIELSQSDANLARQLDRLTLKYLMKTSDLMNSMTPDAQRTVLLRAIRGDKRIYNSLRRLYENAVGVQGPVQPEQAPMAVAAALQITAKGFDVKPHGQSDDAVKGISDTDKAKTKSNKQVIPGHVQFLCDNPRIEGKYTYLDVTWDPADCKGRDEESIRQLLISYAKGLESFKQFIDFGFIGTPHLSDVDVEAGFASIFFRSNKGGDAIPVNEKKE